MSITSENFDTLKCQDNVCFRDMISGTASISETSPFIDEILGVGDIKFKKKSNEKIKRVS